MSIKDTTENISISLPSSLIEEMDLICSKRDTNRSGFIKRAVKQYIARYHSDSDMFWDYLNKQREKRNVTE